MSIYSMLKAALRAQGYDADYLDTGIVGWRAMDKPVTAKDAIR